MQVYGDVEIVLDRGDEIIIQGKIFEITIRAGMDFTDDIIEIRDNHGAYVFGAPVSEVVKG